MPRYTIHADGSLTAPDGDVVIFERIDDHLIHVPHLAPHVIQVPMPRGDTIGIKVIYTSHCWNERYDLDMHGEAPMLIMDGLIPTVITNDPFDG